LLKESDWSGVHPSLALRFSLGANKISRGKRAVFSSAPSALKVVMRRKTSTVTLGYAEDKGKEPFLSLFCLWAECEVVGSKKKRKRERESRTLPVVPLKVS
jgi:hypothetical protein